MTHVLNLLGLYVTTLLSDNKGRPRCEIPAVDASQEAQMLIEPCTSPNPGLSFRWVVAVDKDGQSRLRMRASDASGHSPTSGVEAI